MEVPLYYTWLTEYRRVMIAEGDSCVEGILFRASYPARNRRKEIVFEASVENSTVKSGL